ncbi:glutaminase A L-glutamine amidohydrolase [Teratosphaeria nubilosa]|uniref:Glutaminase A L-glutamine amidohydrolase n=1 Tax=Teratosphaeria nubilosa TaxID=161662 RepID=A0A6G1LGM5_9PEZI|nr:glutaminase A L-glutamine amidohydrolase [Teratosphaeria nubilosa]
MRLCTIPNAFRAWTLIALATVCDAAAVSLPSYPLAVKNPYLSTWVPGSSLEDAASAQPQFWAGQNLTWTVLARVEGKTYSLFGGATGSSISKAITNSYSYTSTHTLVHLTAGSTNFTLDFFSPVLPGATDYVRQSLPYSYLTVNAASSTATSIQILSGIDQTWTAQNGAANLNYTSSGSVGWWQFYNPNEIQYTEVSDQATYGSVIFGTTTGSSVSAAADKASNIYSNFASKGSAAASSRSISTTSLAALAKNLGSVTSGSVTFAVGFERPQAINYLGAAQTGLYRSQWPTVASALSFFLSDYSDVYNTSLCFDIEVRTRSEAVSGTFGSQYADIIEASVRQTFGAIELTVPANNLTAEPQVFLKEISSDGNVNTVDVIFQSWPIFISLNPTYIRYLFQPIMSYLQSGRWPEVYVIHDIGSSYPNATGHDNGVEEDMPLFETSSLFILFYAYQKYTNDTAWAQQYSSLLTQWGNYLVQNTLYPASQLISVDAIPAKANQTGLAIQSIIGLKAAAAITGNQSYAQAASDYATALYNDTLGLDGSTVANSTHFTYYYGQDSTWNVLFPAFSDVLLNLSSFPASAWELQSSWYDTQFQQLGLPFAGPASYTGYTGSAINWALSDWNIVAAGASSISVQEKVINTTHAFLTNGLNNIPFGTKYYVEGANVGKWIANKARSTVGSNFALLALDQGTWSNVY